VRHVTDRKPRPRRRLSDSQLALEVERMGAVCPLSPAEITEWARKLKGAGVDVERGLQNLITYWFAQASSEVRHFVHRGLDQQNSPDALPQHFNRVDEWLPEIAKRLEMIRDDLLALPDGVDAALHVRFGEYGKALEYLAVLPVMLNTIAEAWDRPRSGQPSLERESYAVALLICAIEDFTGTDFQSPRSIKRLAEIELVRLLAGRLFPSLTGAHINTALRHFHKRRLDPARAGRFSPKSGTL
jgi:hypothetical protein